MNLFATIQFSNLTTVNKLQYYHKKIDLIIINEEDVHEFLYFKMVCQRLYIRTNQVMVFVLCKVNIIDYYFISYILKLWKCSFLAVYALCLNFKNEIDIYTFNPFNNREVSNWRKAELTSHYVKAKLGSRFTLYHQIYNKSNNTFLLI